MLNKEFIIFIAYAQEDEDLVNKIIMDLISLKKRNLNIRWYDIRILPGKEVEKEKEEHLMTADVILLMISRNFLASDYCYDKQIAQSIERHNKGEARVIPVILRPSDLEDTPFQKLAYLPTGNKSVIEWKPQDKAFVDISKGIRKAIKDLQASYLKAQQLPENVIPFPGSDFQG